MILHHLRGAMQVKMYVYATHACMHDVFAKAVSCLSLQGPAATDLKKLAD